MTDIVDRPTSDGEGALPTSLPIYESLMISYVYKSYVVII